MNIWVHRLKIDGKRKFLCNADFSIIYNQHNMHLPEKLEWVPFKVKLPDEYEPTKHKDGRVTLEDLTGVRVDLATVLDISLETGGPRLKFNGPADGMPECYVDLEDVDR